MPTFEHRWTVTTRFGPATYEVKISETGEVHITGLPLSGMPDSVLKLTYGSNWEHVRTYLRDLAGTLPYRIAAALSLPTPPPPFQILVEGYRQHQGNTLAYRSSEEGMGLYSFEEAELTAALQRLVRAETTTNNPRELVAYFQALLPTATDSVTRQLFAALGGLHTEEARDALLGFLESEGRHPYTREILRALRQYPSYTTLARLRVVYGAEKISEENLDTYIELLAVIAGPAVADHLVELLDDHPGMVDPIVKAMRCIRLSDNWIASVVRGKFDAEPGYAPLDGLVIALSRLNLTEATVDLAAMNHKVDAPAFTELPPVNWPQQLEPGWAELVRRAPTAEAVAVIGAYLNRPEPRLQRNALLQLKVLLADHLPEAPLPDHVENRLRELVASRYDKVYVEVLNVLGRRALPLADRAAMLDAVLAVSIGSRYRFVVLTALRRIGDAPTYRQRTRFFLQQEIRNTADRNRLEQIGALLPFVEKYLGDTDDLREELSLRVAAGG